MNKIGIMQGRILLDSTDKLQVFPQRWKEELIAIKDLGFEYVELLDDKENRLRRLLNEKKENIFLQIGKGGLECKSVCVDQLCNYSLLKNADLFTESLKELLDLFREQKSFVFVIPFFDENKLNNKIELNTILKKLSKYDHFLAKNDLHFSLEIDLGGYPLIAYSIAAAQLSKLITRIIVSTDSRSIAKIASRYGADVPFLRPKKISKNTSTDKEFFLHAINWLKTKEQQVPDLIVHLRPTTPFRDVEVIDRAITKILRNKKATSLRSTHPNSFPTPFKMVTIKNNYLYFFGKEHFKKNLEYYNFPRQKLPKTYIPNGVVDIIKPKVVLSTGSLHGNKIMAMVTENVADIDSRKDLNYAETILSTHKYEHLLRHLNKV